MKIIKIIDYCLSLPEVKEDFPFGPDVQVFKIKNKLFAILTKRQGIYSCLLYTSDAADEV